ncbi:MAG: 2-amino-4-hydroxy-6-hydroxymethyldihydropteridine diphosphokinase [Nitrospina sp.]|nr:2-amino-4-hydroxy-6-hydroxymethyldihydropteridine diphosphokinase [Nitrospina sp.]
MPETVYIGLGSNLGAPEDNLRAALERLAQVEGVERIAVSPFYRTAPFGITDQPEFINAVARLSTTLEPRALLDTLLEIEKEMGRVRKQKWGPRLIDLDILLFGGRVIEEPGLTVPHPGIAERGFVLAPLADLAADLPHPTLKQNVKQLYDALGASTDTRRIESEG